MGVAHETRAWVASFWGTVRKQPQARYYRLTTAGPPTTGNPLAIGLAGSLARAMAGAVVLLGAFAVLACVAPARRAAALDPLAALRHE